MSQSFSFSVFARPAGQNTEKLNDRDTERDPGPSQATSPAVCIFAGGLSSLYPRANLPVFRRLWHRHAALVSERLWESPCRPADFAARNRLIAGLSPLTVVMQAAVRSGAMVTARLALDAGRQVAVLRHPPDDVRADGSAALLESGAPGFATARELLSRLSAADGQGRGGVGDR